MLLRFVSENVFSFKNATEFNTFPSSKSHNHEGHKISCGHATALRLSAIYGANAAGKSNLLQAIGLLKQMVEQGNLRGLNSNIPFRLDHNCLSQPSGIAMEFSCNDKVFYYHIEFKDSKVVQEELLLSRKTSDTKLFTRDSNGITLNGDFAGKGIHQAFIDALDRLVRPEMLALSFLGEYYSSEFPLAAEAYQWIRQDLQLVFPGSHTGLVPHLLDATPAFAALTDKMISAFGLGISGLKVHKETFTEDDAKNNNDMMELVRLAKITPDEPIVRVGYRSNGTANLVYENHQFWVKTLVAIHTNADGTKVEMPLTMESDGTRRMIDFMPLLYALSNRQAVYVVDEIERSIHPILIKAFMRLLSTSNEVKGQLIFTTHESGLLDQSIFRPDEIWFAQKDTEQATQLYPLSDFNIHKTAKIENGYLNGRYGGIPFLSNLNDLHWI